MRAVHQLTKEEFEELADRHMIEFDLDEVSYYDIFDYYSGTSFVDEDFFCNI